MTGGGAAVTGFLICSFWNLSKQSLLTERLTAQLTAPTERPGRGVGGWGPEQRNHVSESQEMLSPVQERGFDDIIAPQNKGERPRGFGGGGRMPNKREFKGP